MSHLNWDLSRLKLIGTEEIPLRSSALQKMVQCPMRALVTIMEGDDSSGQAADTGSAMHKAAAMWHLNNQDVIEALKHMHLFGKEYPLADMKEAEELFRAYTKDKRNKEAETVLVEEKISFSMPPHKEDETQAPIVIHGTLDQVRRVDGDLYLYDIKTTKKAGSVALQSALYQMAAYCLGASIRLNEPVSPGALILPRTYLKKENKGVLQPAGVFWHIPWNLSHLPAILDGLKVVVAALRRGDVWVNPSEDCFWCPEKSIDHCIPKVQKLKLKLRNEHGG